MHNLLLGIIITKMKQNINFSLSYLLCLLFGPFIISTADYGHTHRLNVLA